MSEGRLADNIVHFTRLLRAAGLRRGPGAMLDAVRAVATVGIERRDDLYWALHAVLVTRHDEHELFDQAFHLFWRDPQLLDRAMALLLPSTEGLQNEADARARRLMEALHGEPPPPVPTDREGGEEIDARLSMADDEVLQTRDFEAMSLAEQAAAKAAMARLVLPLKARPTRRLRPDPRGRRIDLRASLRRQAAGAGSLIPLVRQAPDKRPPPLVVLADISGSMATYSRLLLHFLHALVNDRERVHIFLFGTRLTNITRELKDRDVDAALDRVGSLVEDWAGGTRIGAALHAFNRHWSRRVLGQGAVVLLVTDGLDRDAGEGLAFEIDRLHRSCRRLIWLNPLLRYDGFAPKSMGVRAMIDHVDEFRPVHNLAALGDLVQALGRNEPIAQNYNPRRWRDLNHGRS